MMTCSCGNRGKSAVKRFFKMAKLAKLAGREGFEHYVRAPDLSTGFSAGALRSRSKQQAKVGAGPRNHLYLLGKFGNVGHPHGAALD